MTTTDLLDELAHLRAAHRRVTRRQQATWPQRRAEALARKRAAALPHVPAASDALYEGAEAIALAARLGFVSADEMVDAVLSWRRTSAVVAGGGRATGRDIPRGEVASSPSPRLTATTRPHPLETTR